MLLVSQLNAQSKKIKQVVLIGVDGLGVYAISQAEMTHLKNSILTYDNAVTLTCILGLEVPEAWHGKVVAEVFER